MQGGMVLEDWETKAQGHKVQDMRGETDADHTPDEEVPLEEVRSEGGVAVKYTEGKWQVYESPFAPAIIIDRPRRLIATCHLELGSEGMSEATANAHLTASAVNGCISVNTDNPQAVGEAIKEMYEALQDIVKEASRTHLPIGADLADSINVFGKQALAKAEGKEEQK